MTPWNNGEFEQTTLQKSWFSWGTGPVYDAGGYAVWTMQASNAGGTPYSEVDVWHSRS